MICCLLLCLLAGGSFSLEVRQSASDLIKIVGDEMQIFCTHNKTDYTFMLWYQRSPGDMEMKLIGYLYVQAVTMEEGYKEDFRISGDLRGSTAKNASLLLSHVGQQHSAVYYCAASDDDYDPAYFGGGTKLTVLETNQPITPPTVTLLPPSQHECYNQKDKEKKKTLVCVASAFYPDHVSVFWSMNGHNVTTGVATDDRALRNGAHYSLTSRLRVNATTWFTPANRFTCTVSFFNGTDSSHHSDGVAGSPGGEETMTREKYLRITQSAKLSYVVLMVKSLIYGAFVVFLVWKPQVQKKALKREDRKDRI